MRCRYLLLAVMLICMSIVVSAQSLCDLEVPSPEYDAAKRNAANAGPEAVQQFIDELRVCVKDCKHQPPHPLTLPSWNQCCRS